MFRVLRPFYRLIKNSSFVKKITKSLIKPKVAYFNRPNGVEMQLLLGKIVIGRRAAGGNNWEIKRPFEVFIDEDDLPEV